jgi:phosphoribosylcarboxyaminoimidazole (NCAIR) mutase
MNQESAQVGIIMGSKSDLPIMQEAANLLKELGVRFEITVVSAHRTPERMFQYAKTASDRGLNVIIAGAGGLNYSFAGNRSSDKVFQLDRRLGFYSFYSSNAQRNSGGNSSLKRG